MRSDDSYMSKVQSQDVRYVLAYYVRSVRCGAKVRKGVRFVLC